MVISLTGFPSFIMDSKTVEKAIHLINDYHSEFGKLVKIMVAHGISFEDCVELNRFSVSPRELFDHVPKVDEILDFHLWLAHLMSPSDIVETLEKTSSPDVNFWRSILTSKFNSDSLAKYSMPRLIAFLLHQGNYDILDLLHELGVSFKSLICLRFERFADETCSRSDYLHERLQYLLEKGADPNAISYSNCGLNRLYLHCSDPKIVQLLMSYGANPRLKNNIGSPLSRAIKAKYYESANIMLAEKEIDVDQEASAPR